MSIFPVLFFILMLGAMVASMAAAGDATRAAMQSRQQDAVLGVQWAVGWFGLFVIFAAVLAVGLLIQARS